MPYLVGIPERTYYCFKFLFVCLFVEGNWRSRSRGGGGVKRGRKYGQRIMYERRIKKIIVI